MRRALFAAVIVILVSISSIAWQALAYKDKIFPGVSIGALEVGGLTPKQAKKRLLRLRPAPKYIRLATDNYQEKLDLSEYSAVPDIDQAVGDAYKYGRNDSLGALAVLIGRGQPINIPLEFRLNASKLKRHFEDIAWRIDQPPVNAVRLISGDRISIEPEQIGYKLLVDDSVERVKTALNKKEARLAIKVERPKITYRLLKRQKIEVLMGEFATEFDRAQDSRNTNIKTAARQIDGTMIPPNGIFSFNEIVGPRTAERGYKPATVIENGNLVQGIGGGICQVATTLYNAYMLAGLPTVERVIHSNFIAAYPTGRDASVAEGLYDLKFKNDTNDFILIKTFIGDSILIVRVYGPKVDRVNYFSEPAVSDFVSYQVKVEPDSSLPPGVKIVAQKGVSGRTVKVRRTVKLKDQILFEEDIVSRYLPRTEIIKAGPGETTTTSIPN